MSGAAHILLALGIPLAGALGIVLAARRPNIREAVTLLAAAALAWNVWTLLPRVLDGARPQISLFQMLPGVDLAFRLEPLGMLFAALASLLWIVNSVYSIGYMRGNREANQTRFYACFALAFTATMGIAFAGNLLTLFLFYEMLTLSTYPLVAHKGDAHSVARARVYLGVLLTTSIALFLPAIVWTWMEAGTLEFTDGGILPGKLDGWGVGVLLALFVFGIGKAAVMPVHRWLPAAMVAPTPVSALLHAVAVVKAGVFSILKIIVYIFGTGDLFAEASSHWLLYAAAITVLGGSLVALKENNFKRMLAYSTVSHLSYIVLAAAVLKPLSNIGAALHMVAHGFGKITLFFVAGSIYTASGKTLISELNGIGRRMPWTMAAFTIGALSLIGVPPTGGFVSKWYILSGAFQADNYVALFTVIGSTVLNAAYLLPIVYAAYFMEENVAPRRPHGEAPVTMVLAMLAGALLTLGFFFFNAPAVELERQLHY
jgi:multicomponent Na+:H+ antiporter subunit D